MNLQFAILGMLMISSMNGYYLKKIFDRSVHYFWAASLSQIYRELGVLEKKGFVLSSIETQNDRPDKRVYTITAAGREAFSAWLKNCPEKLETEKRDEFAMRIFFGAYLGREELKKQFEKFIEERKAFIDQMARDKKDIVEMTQSLQAASPEAEMCMRFVTRRAQLSNELLIQWAEECIRELDQAAEQTSN